MGKGRPRAVETGQNLTVSSTGSLNILSGPVYYPSEEEFRDPLGYIYKIRPEAEPYGICKIVPPKTWNPPFSLNLDSFTFPTKTQAIHQLQARPASCDSKTFELEYNRFLEGHCGKKLKKRVIFEGEELDLCKLFNAVRRYGGYDKVVKGKKWGEVFRFVRSGKKISECAKHVLCQLYREHLYDYEGYYNRLNQERAKSYKRGINEDARNEKKAKIYSSKRRRKNSDHRNVKVCKVEEEDHDQICEQCRSGLHGEVMLLCDRCNKGWHIYCLSPPLKQVPPGNWYCFECLNSDKDSFGFIPGKQFTLEAFRRLADRANKKWFGSGCASRVQIEKKFWEIVEGLAGDVEVMYGSDLDTSVHGSGFPRVNDQRPESVEPKAWDEYCKSPWNLNNLPKLKGSMLRAVHHNITGVMVPWLYIGMLFSAFCWHFEDHCFYSMNYLHWGEPKCWYSVPGSEASAFEKVMRDCLPDLFDAQPDLLFQLVTMLNPSVLRENGVPVYSVLQHAKLDVCDPLEPGNFVITFPRSYHGGFNLGLNCAEAVNFAPADWLPHGGSGAELYQLYRKAPVLSHEELLCVVAKSDWDKNASTYLRKELLRIYKKERTFRERLWLSGITRSSPMSPRRSPEFVGTEEDPTCIICKQYLYLSAVVCRCRPSAFVCLEHWEHLCECKSSKHRLLYRHTLAELADLVLMVDKHESEEMPQSDSLLRNISSSSELNSLKKKVKGAHVTHAQLAEQWLSQACKIFQSPFSGDAYTTLLKEAEQFLWAGAEMDSVRNVVKNLTAAWKWVQGIRDCLSKIENWSAGGDFEKVAHKRVKKLLSVDPVPCNEPGCHKLKHCAEEANLLVHDIDAALSTFSKLDELELLYSRACSSSIHVEQSQKLSQKISLVKVWIDNARKAISNEQPAAVEVDILYKLKTEILELQVQVQEKEMIFDLVSQAESCQARCRSLLSGSVTLKDVEVLLQEMASFSVNIPELALLKQYQIDASLWITKLNDILINIHQREDQQSVINELNRILEDGESLKIQVDELSLVKIELKKACCREKAIKAINSKMALDFLQQLLADAVVLQIEREDLFLRLSRELAGALQWEERAKDILACKAQMSEFEDLIRMSEDIVAIMPSLGDVKAAILVANSWLNNSKPFLEPDLSGSSTSHSLLKLDDLKVHIAPSLAVSAEVIETNLRSLFYIFQELVSQSRFLKITFKQQNVLETILENSKRWQHDACSLLQDVECLYSVTDIGDGKSNGLILKIEHIVNLIESVSKAGLSFGLDFPEMPKLQNACSTLHWCSKVLSFCYLMPSYEVTILSILFHFFDALLCLDVESLMNISEQLSIMHSSCNLLSSLIFGAKWLKKVSEVISAPVKCNAFKLTDAEEMLAAYQDISVAFPMMVAQLTEATYKQRLWQEQVHQFFSLKLGERSWSQLMQLEEYGKASFFTCPEVDIVVSEVEKVEKWKQRCMDAVKTFAGDESSLLCALQKIKESLDRSLYIYEKSESCGGVCLYMCCMSGSEDWDFLTCSTCKDCYHLQCLEYRRNNAEEAYTCSYCQLLVGGLIPPNRCGFLRHNGKYSDLKLLSDLLFVDEKFCVRIEEREILQKIVDQAYACKKCLTEILDFEMSCYNKDQFTAVGKKLTTAWKAFGVAGVYDHQSYCDLERALARLSWRFQVARLLDALEKDLEKPSVQQVYQHLKEFFPYGQLAFRNDEQITYADMGDAMNISPEDHLRLKLSELKDIGLQWVDRAKKVAADCGALGLDGVYELITEGERLPVCLKKELEVLRARSRLHCICRKPYDERSMIVCGRCDEWYHIRCVNLVFPPKVYICAACMPGTQHLVSSFDSLMDHERCTVEPKTPSPRHKKPRTGPKKSESSATQKMLIGDENGSGIGHLRWRNRKPFRRAAKKRAELDSLTSFFHRPQPIIT
ncbi:lysine-specific demethylase 5B isoform X2 [Gossypium australe]|uniref:Lysine-specific demethylase 5B isoform X2 n=1 Tax=Gossypium australe TaxID=47621 RepID=A0A5B6VIR9_9ROSI|nr:lysine-specific demethylase 5B isoform X2 [Gossypium australe]